MNDQWVPCGPDWLEKFPGACESAPRRPGRPGTGVSHYHLGDNPPVSRLAQMPIVELPRFLPREI